MSRTAPGGGEQSGEGAGQLFSPGRLRAVRDLHDWTRADLAARAGATAAEVTGYETGATTPDANALAALAAALGVAPADLCSPAGAKDSWEYWGVICAARPPMTDHQIGMLATAAPHRPAPPPGEGMSDCPPGTGEYHLFSAVPTPRLPRGAHTSDTVRRPGR